MHNAAIERLRLNWRYLAFDTPPDELEQAIAGAKAMRFIGLNLTVPHKLLAMDLMDELDESAQMWGAVNTVRFEGEAGGIWKPLGMFGDHIPDRVRSVGFNTDADAIVRSPKEGLQMVPHNIDVLLLGAGGAARVTALKLAAEGVRSLHLVNRTVAKARELADTLRGRYPKLPVTVGYPAGAVHIVVNATSLGLQPEDPLPLDGSKFPFQRAQAVFDMIYRPAETPLLRSARVAGCRTTNGFGMLLYQGAKALELWSGRPAPMDVMRRALEKNIYEH